MEILIKLDKRTYKYANHHTLTSIEIDEICDAIANGTILPKSHGRMIDADGLLENKIQIIDEVGTVMDVVEIDMINDAPTIIESDIGSEET